MAASDLPSARIVQLQAVIAGLHTPRAVLGDTLVDTPLHSLHAELAQLAAARSHQWLTDFDGERKFTTFLFADLAGFTARVEVALRANRMKSRPCWSRPLRPGI